MTDNFRDSIPHDGHAMNSEDPIAATRRWLERAVVGLNLCPCAKAGYAKQHRECETRHRPASWDRFGEQLVLKLPT